MCLFIYQIRIGSCHMKVGKSKIFRVDWQTGDTEEPMLQVQSEDHQAGDLGELMLQFECKSHLL